MGDPPHPNLTQRIEATILRYAFLLDSASPVELTEDDADALASAAQRCWIAEPAIAMVSTLGLAGASVHTATRELSTLDRMALVERAERGMLDGGTFLPESDHISVDD